MAKFKHFPDPGPLERIPMTRLRPQLSEVVELVSRRGVKFLLTHHGRQVAAMVSIADFWRIWEDEELDLMGPKNPETGTRPGMGWVQETGWRRGMQVDWTEAGPVVVAGRVAEIPLPAGQKRRWWWG